MPNDLDTSVGDFSPFVYGKNLPESVRRPGRVPVYGSNGIVGYHDVPLTDGPAVIVGRKGTVGAVHYSSVPCWPIDTTFYTTDRDPGVLRFKYYLLRSLGLEHMNGDSAVPGLNRDAAHAREINIPSDKQSQIAIAKILGDLDDKIKLNSQMNETLENIASTIFKSWFLDFDPVRAKSASKPTGLAKEISDLFPTRLGGSELGEIPDGWHVGAVYEVADVIYGAPFSSSQFNTAHAGLPIIRIRDLRDEAPAVWTQEVHPKGYKVQPGDIVVGMDGEFRSYLWGGVEAWLNQRVCVFSPKPGWSAAFVRNSIIPLLAEVEATETATTVIHIGKGDIDRFRVVVPDAKVAIAFNKVCQPLYDRIVAAKAETRSLSSMRDTLLPKLMSGEIRVI